MTIRKALTLLKGKLPSAPRQRFIRCAKSNYQRRLDGFNYQMHVMRPIHRNKVIEVYYARCALPSYNS